MTDHQWDTLRRTAMWMGLLGVLISLVGCGLRVWVASAITSWPVDGIWPNLVISFLDPGIPMLGGVMIALWITVAVWARSRQSAQPSLEVGHDK